MSERMIAMLKNEESANKLITIDFDFSSLCKLEKILDSLNEKASQLKESLGEIHQIAGSLSKSFE